ncbi:Uncharacterized protein, contains FMN-binding domain [Lachnospiraceae bacterium XBB1006]|nr:Uncharacterized protein, contains FMN-binding domain [Lachnospiraceae bacterium XBB1006]
MKKKNVNRFLAGAMAVMLATTNLSGVPVAYAADPQATAYNDGTYEGVGTGLKGSIKLTVSIKDGKVEAVSEKEQHESSDRWAMAKAMIASFVGRNYEEAEAVDGVSGATYSSNGIRNAVKDAFFKASGSITGSGTWDDPYLIQTAKQLEQFAATVDNGKTYEGDYVSLDADLDLADIKNFNPIGGEDGKSEFQGTFDGRNHVISNLKLNYFGADYVGFFARLGASATVKNLTIRDAVVTADSETHQNVGILAGGSTASPKNINILNCHADGSVKVENITDAEGATNTVNVGGILGQTERKTTFANCSAKVDLSVLQKENWSTHETLGTANVGGICGTNGANVSFYNVASAGTIKVENATTIHAGGITSLLKKKMDNAVSTMEVPGGTYCGALVGETTWGSVIQNAYYLKNGQAVGKKDEKMTLVVDERTEEEFSNPSFIKEMNSHLKGIHKENKELSLYTWVQQEGMARPCGDVWQEKEVDASIFEKGDGSAENPFCIVNKEQLKAFAASLEEEVCYEDAYVVLGADIDLSEEANWEPIGGSQFAFDGTFDGCGHTIKGLKEGTEEQPRKLSKQLEDFSNALGLFGTLGVHAVVKNLHLTDVAMYAYREDAMFVGGIAGYMEGMKDGGSYKGAVIDGCSVTGIISATTAEKNCYAAGIAARQYKGAIINCYTKVDVRSKVEYGESIAAAGGITAMTNRGLVANCYTTGRYFGSMARDIENEIEGMSSVGTLIGVDAGDIVNCYGSGDTISEHYSIYTGAVIGWVTGIGKAYQCYYDKEKEMRIAGRKEADVQAYGTKTVGGVNEEGVAFEGGVVDQLEAFDKASYAGLVEKLNGNFKQFGIDLSKYGIDQKALHTWTLQDGEVTFAPELATVTYVQPSVEIVPQVPLVMQDGVWYGREADGTVVVKITVKNDTIEKQEVIEGDGNNEEAVQKALLVAKNKAYYGDSAVYGKGDASRFAGGDGSKAHPYLIETEEQLRYVAEAIGADETWENKYFLQTKDIKLSDKDWKPIGWAIKAKVKGNPILISAYPFRGHFDGGNHTISKLHMGSKQNPVHAYTAAMFGFTGGDYESNLPFGEDTLKVTLENIHLTEVYINNEVPYDTYTAGLVGTGQNGVFINRCSVQGKILVSADDIASRGAGLAASMLRGGVYNSYTDVDITAMTEDGDVYAGGMFAVTNRVNTINCYTLGDVCGSANTNNKVHLGGFTGMAGGFMYNCFAAGNVTSYRPTVDLGIAEGRIANIAYDRNCYFNMDAVRTENGKVLPSVYTGADGTGSSKDTTFGKTKAELGSKEFAALLNRNCEKVVSELAISDEELGGIMSIYYTDGAKGLDVWSVQENGLCGLDGTRRKTVDTSTGSTTAGYGDKDATGKETNPQEAEEPKPSEEKQEGTKTLVPKQVADKVVSNVTLTKAGIFVDKQGKVLANTIVKAKSGKLYITDKQGKKRKNQIVKTAKGTYYAVKKNGVVARSTLVKIKGNLYYASKSGRLVTKKWVRVGKMKYYCSKTAKITKKKKIK